MIHRTVVVEEFSVIKNCYLAKGAHISSCVRIEENCSIGRNTFIGHGVVMRPDTYIGDNCKVGHHTVFEGGCSIGNNTLIQAQSNITRGVIVGDRVFIGMQFCGGNDMEIVHERWDKYGEFQLDPYRIEDFVRIGFGVHVLPGVVIKKNAFVAAGSLVTKDVKEGMKVKGRPARVYDMVNQEYRL